MLPWNEIELENKKKELFKYNQLWPKIKYFDKNFENSL